MKIYLSQPMTLATHEDRRVIAETRHRLKREFPRLQVWDPGLQDDSDLDMEAIQNRDFLRLGESDGCLAIWSQTAEKSAGMAAELEWCRRAFSIPVVIYQPTELYRIPAWTRATVRGRVRHELCEAVRCLMEFQLDC